MRAGLAGLAELLIFAYRDFISDPNSELVKLEHGRAHHRVLHFANRHPGLRVADLLDILKFTKQSLGHVLKQLIDGGYIEQMSSQLDRRERLLYPTQRGSALADRLIAPEIERIAHALRAAGSQTVDAVRDFLNLSVREEDRATGRNGSWKVS